MTKIEDIPYFLAVARWGSLSEAAKRLGSSQPTVGRRIASLEDQLGLVLFDRVSSGYRLTKAGRLLLEKALIVENATRAFSEEASNQHRQVKKTIRISATEGLGVYLLTPVLKRFGAEFPDTTLELIVDNDSVDLLQRQADIAIRLARPMAPDLIAKRIGSMSFRLFASKSYLQEHPPPENLGGISGHSLVTFSQRSSISDETWQSILDIHDGPTFKTNSSLAQLAAVRCGFGISLLAAYSQNLFDDLTPIFDSRLWRKREIWLAAHPDMKKVPTIALAYNFIAVNLKVG